MSTSLTETRPAGWIGFYRLLVCVFCWKTVRRKHELDAHYEYIMIKCYQNYCKIMQTSRLENYANILKPLEQTVSVAQEGHI